MLGRYHYWQSNPTRGNSRSRNWRRRYVCSLTTRRRRRRFAMAWNQGRDLVFTQSEGSRREAAQKAIELDPSLAEGYAALAGIKFDEWDWDGTLAAYEKALELNPESIDVCGCYGNTLAAFGRFDEAMRIIEQAISANPLLDRIALQLRVRALHGQEICGL